MVVIMTNTSTDCVTMTNTSADCVTMTNTSADCVTMTSTDCETCLLFRLQFSGQFFIQAARIAVFAGFVIQFNFFRSVSPPNNFPA